MSKLNKYIFKVVGEIIVFSSDKNAAEEEAYDIFREGDASLELEIFSINREEPEYDYIGNHNCECIQTGKDLENWEWITNKRHWECLTCGKTQ